MALPALVRALMRPSSYPRPVEGVELVQTHISWVFLAGADVYKVKKPVDFGFADFTTLEKRRAACEAEVRLNRRGCPGNVYIGVEPITRKGRRYRVGGNGEAVDYAVHMRHLPADRMMDRLLERGQVTLEMVGLVAARLADLHRQAARGPETTKLGGFEQHVANWRENLAEMRRMSGRVFTPAGLRVLESFASRDLGALEQLMRRRETEGWVRDCHGDLRSDAVCFDPAVPGGVCLFDCIEFNDTLRYSDTGLDAAFLAMDLDFRGRPDLSDLFVGLYAAAIGDSQLPLLLPLFKCYRATVRAKVEGLLLEDVGVSRNARAAARKRARAYVRLAAGYVRRPKDRRALLLVTGPSGSGKSVLAGALAARMGAVLLSTDVVRHSIFPEARAAALDSDTYSPEARRRIYEEIERRAGAEMADGHSVVVDGTYLERAQRLPLVELAKAHRVRLLVIECDAPDEVVKERQERRSDQPWTVSQARWEVYVAQKARAEPVTEVPASRRITIDTTAPLETQLGRVTAVLRKRKRSGTAGTG